MSYDDLMYDKKENIPRLNVNEYINDYGYINPYNNELYIKEHDKRIVFDGFHNIISVISNDIIQYGGFVGIPLPQWFGGNNKRILVSRYLTNYNNNS